MSYTLLIILSLPHAESNIPASLTDADVLERAETEFQEGVKLRTARQQARPHFANAVLYFEELRRRGVSNPILYHNLGNSYLLADDLPRAILAYHQGLHLAPNNLALRESLAEARERVIYPASGNLGRPPIDARPPWWPHIHSGWLLLFVVISYVLGCMSLTRWLMVRRGRLLGAGITALIVAGLFSVWLMIRAEEERERLIHPFAVIARDGVLLRRGNGNVFPPRYETPVNRGVEGRLRFERDGWVQIELSGEEIGWLPREAILVDAY